MEPHVKERIVGAAILVALGVWLIPWVLDGPDRAGEATEAQLDELLPAAGDAAPVRTETVELDPAPPVGDPERVRDAGNAGEPAPVESVAGTGLDEGGRRASEGAAPAESEASGDGRLAAAPEAGSGAAADARPDRAANAETRADQAADVGARPGAASAPSPSVSTAARDGWAVQLGAFGDIANADQLASRVSTYGYSAYVSEFRSGGETMHRVRVGGFQSENEAAAAASSLSAHGFPGRVISPE